MSRLRFALVGLVGTFLGLGLAACGDDSGGSDCQPGTVGCECYQGTTCWEGLTCSGGICVDADGGDGDGGDGGTDGGDGDGGTDGGGDGDGGTDGGGDGDSGTDAGDTSDDEGWTGRCSEEQSLWRCGVGDCAFEPETINCPVACANVSSICTADPDCRPCDGQNTNAEMCETGCDYTRDINCPNLMMGCFGLETTCEAVNACVEEHI
jgi:hypothetical protein